MNHTDSKGEWPPVVLYTVVQGVISVIVELTNQIHEVIYRKNP